MEQLPLREDIELVQELLGIDSRTFSADLGISRMTLNRWAKEPVKASNEKLEVFYGYAFEKGIRLNQIHAQLFEEEAIERGLMPLFHGSKRGIEGELSLGASRSDNDFGPGFYCGENFAQSAMFVARFHRPICYFVALDEGSLRKKVFSVDDEWMLAVAFFRGKLSDLSDNPTIKAIASSVARADVVIAPIADNRMFEIIDSFIEGEITDEQCRHSLSATNLGMQHVLKSEAALRKVVRLQPHFICAAEKATLLVAQKERVSLGNDKVKAAKRKYRAQGRYIEELIS